MGRSRNGLAVVVAGVMGLAGAASASTVPERPATLNAINAFLNRTEQVLHRRFTATYRISLFPYKGRAFRGRVSVSNWSLGKLLFRENPGFSFSGPVVTHAYEVLEGSGPYVINCTQARFDSSWYCISEQGDGMGGAFLQNGAVIPQAFSDGLSNAVADYTRQSGAPYALFLSRKVANGWDLRCLSFGNRAGAVGRVCTMASGLIVSYRLPHQLTDTYYASAELTSYSSKVSRSVLRPPANPTCPAAPEVDCQP